MEACSCIIGYCLSQINSLSAKRRATVHLVSVCSCKSKPSALRSTPPEPVSTPPKAGSTAEGELGAGGREGSEPASGERNPAEAGGFFPRVCGTPHTLRCEAPQPLRTQRNAAMQSGSGGVLADAGPALLTGTSRSPASEGEQQGDGQGGGGGAPGRRPPSPGPSVLTRERGRGGARPRRSR